MRHWPLNHKHLRKCNQGDDCFYTNNGNAFVKVMMYNSSTNRYFISNNTSHEVNKVTTLNHTYTKTNLLRIFNVKD